MDDISFFSEVVSNIMNGSCLCKLYVIMRIMAHAYVCFAIFLNDYYSYFIYYYVWLLVHPTSFLVLFSFNFMGYHHIEKYQQSQHDGVWVCWISNLCLWTFPVNILTACHSKIDQSREADMLITRFTPFFCPHLCTVSWY